MSEKSIHFYTLGCKLNFSETSAIARSAKEHGYHHVDFESGADVYVINTCSVTDHADKKCRKIVQEIQRFNPVAQIIIIGCYAQLKPEEISRIPGVSMVLGASEKFMLMEHLQNLPWQPDTVTILNQPIKEANTFHPAFSMGDRTRTFLKVQDGCDYFCSFCTIPLARGFSRSSTIREVLQQVKQIEENEVKEVVLTGVNLGDFGFVSGQAERHETFTQLVETLESECQIPRFRISSIEPNLLTDEIIRLTSGSRKFMPHFHIPLQSGDDSILQAMRRRYTRDFYAGRIHQILKEIPDACIGVDVIVGFPGETEEKFLHTYKFLNELPISYLHVFPYSERPDTTAVRMKEKVLQRHRNERVEMLRILSEKKKRAFYAQQLGKVRPVLFEKDIRQGFIQGFSDNYVKVSIPYDPMWVNEIVPVKLNAISIDGNVEGEPVILQPIHSAH